MTQERTVVFDNGRYNGRTLIEWLPDIVARIVERFAPLQVIVFGSLAKGQEGPDSDIDLLVVLPRVEDKRQAAIEIGVATADFPVPMDIIVTDPEEISSRGSEPGSVLKAALTEGRVVYDHTERRRPAKE
ncbi:MAG: nucleotidyltransferase domain-containing protein [Limnochordales bacterium]|nr:nucleotidyltransferase domain-containing protein [Limnochordales bacterium]